MRQQAKNVLEAFLDHGEKRVLLFTGDWGVGKSYFMKDFLTNYRKNEGRKIAVASLYGLSAINGITSRIEFINDTEQDPMGLLGKFLINAKKYVGDKISIPGIDIKLDNAFEQIVNMMLKVGILVFDDVERKNDNLPLEAIFGTANQLTENAVRKAIIVLSENNLNEKDKIFLRDHREKLIDTCYHFAPSPQENADILFPDDAPLASIVESLEISNLRISKQIKWACNALVADFKIENPSVISFLYHRIALLSYIHLSVKVPLNLSDVQDHMSYLLAEDDSPAVKKRRFLEKFHYYYTENDLPIIYYLQNGFFEEETWRKIVKNYIEEEEKGQIKERHGEVWDIFHGSFLTGEDDIKKVFSEFLEGYAEYLSPLEVYDMVEILGKLGFNIKEHDWMDKCLEAYSGNMSNEQVEFVSKFIHDKASIEHLRQKLNEKKYKSSISVALDKIVRKGGWSNEDTDCLVNATVDDFKTWLTKPDEDNSIRFVAHAVEMLKNLGGSANYNAIGERLEQAVREICNNSELNKIRFGILFENKRRGEL
jgi:hypothetical protein